MLTFYYVVIYALIPSSWLVNTCWLFGWHKHCVFLFFLFKGCVNTIQYRYYILYTHVSVCLCNCVFVHVCCALLCFACVFVRFMLRRPFCFWCVCVCYVVQCVENHLDHLSKKCLAGASSPHKVVSLPSQALGLSLVNQPINLSVVYTQSSCLLVRLILVSGRVGYHYHTVTCVNKTR